MAFAECDYSKKKVDAAGRFLIDPSSWSYDEDALVVINSWRTSHAYPLQAVANTLRNRARKVDENCLVAQRIKRLSSIRKKLQESHQVHSETMLLTRMQDIGGCRAVMKSVVDVRSVYEMYLKSHQNDPNTEVRTVLAKTFDLNAEPRADGYTGIHLRMRYQTDTAAKKCYQGHLIEIQIRTELQHAWATAVETSETFTDQALKSKTKSAKAEWLRFFELTGSLFALHENRPPVPNTPTTKLDIVRELKDLDDREKIVATLQGFRVAINHVESRDSGDSQLYLLTLNFKDRRLAVNAFAPRDAMFAESEYLRIERQYLDDPDINIVLVAVSSIKSLKQAFPNYYLDSSRFVDAVVRELGDK